MIFNYKDVLINGKKFMIKYLTEVKDYELNISNNVISIGVFYYPESLMSLHDAQNNLEINIQAIMNEVKIILDNNYDFYKDYEPDEKFTGLGSTGYRFNGDVVAENAHTVLLLKLKTTNR